MKRMIMGKTLVKKAASLAVLAVMALCMAACGRTPSDVVRTYMDSCNRGDVDAMLDCLDPDSAALIRGATDIAASQFGLDADTLISISSGMTSIMNAYGYGYTMDYAIKGESVRGDTATVTVDFNLSAGGETAMSGESLEVPLVKIGGKWYISGLG